MTALSDGELKIASEEMVLNKSREMGLEEYKDIKLQGVEIEFEEVDSLRKRSCDYFIDAEGILKIRLRDTDLDSGVKLCLASSASQIEARSGFASYREYFMHDFFYPWLYPLIVLVISIYLVAFAPSGLDSSVLGPLFFSVMVLPTSFWRMRQENELKQIRIENVRHRLEPLALFSSTEEIADYARLVCRTPTTHPASSFFMYCVNLPFLVFLIAMGL
ncbi:MAG: hypothetical protein ACFFEX_17080 [Candidatus Thorarchaeota archaeon]